jgi:hypothetical protein
MEDGPMKRDVVLRVLAVGTGSFAVGALLGTLVIATIPSAAVRPVLLALLGAAVASAVGAVGLRRAALNGPRAKEEFANLTEAVAPALARATREEKRQRFRDLLFKAVQLQPGDAAWDRANLAGELLQQIEVPGLVILAGVAKRHPSLSWLYPDPTPRIYMGEGPEGPKDAKLPTGPFDEILFEWPVVSEWARRLSDIRLLRYQVGAAQDGLFQMYLFPGNYNPNTGRITGGSWERYLDNYNNNSSRSRQRGGDSGLSIFDE